MPPEPTQTTILGSYEALPEADVLCRARPPLATAQQRSSEDWCRAAMNGTEAVPYIGIGFINSIDIDRTGQTHRQVAGLTWNGPKICQIQAAGKMKCFE